MNTVASLSAIASQTARHFSGRGCLTYGNQHWTFAQFHAQFSAIAAGLLAQLGRGSRVGLFMSNRPEYVLLQFALEKAGLVRVPLNMRFTGHEVAAILEDCGASAVFFDSATFDRASVLAEKMPQLWWCQVDGREAIKGKNWASVTQAVGPVPTLTQADDLCTINYTSGTSGKPKGVMLSHRNWAALYRNMLIDRDMRCDDVVGHVGPLTHASGTYFVPWYLRGARNVIVEGASIDGLLEAIERERITVFTCVPTALTRIVNHPDIERFDLSSLRAIGYGAEPIPYNTLEKALDRFGSILTQNYGLTEAMMTVATLSPGDHLLPDDGTGKPAPRVGCIGRPYTFVEVVLRGEDGEPVPVGEVGEITVRSEHVMQGYWNLPEETAKVLRDGWLWSGDLARCDDAGFITISGRSKDMLISGGFNIYPAEVEAVLTSHPCVLEAAVVGIPDAQWGEIPIAFVALAPGETLTAAQLVDYCKPLLGFKTPRRLRFVNAIPKNANGKVDKPKLKVEALTVLESENV
ncbi:MAG: AMP-binding protein [Sulfuricaulis sp.]|nr:AMP-binding protein [Sulfuricaulis sp.]